MRRFILLGLLITALFAFSMTVAAIDEDSACQSPFSAAQDESILTVNQTGLAADTFADRLLFENLNVLRTMNIRLDELTQQAESMGIPPSALIMTDPVFIQLHDEVRSGVTLGERVLDDLVAEALLWQYLSDQNLTITNEMLDANAQGVDAELDAVLQRAGVNETIRSAYLCRLALYDLAATSLFGAQDSTLYINSAHIVVTEEAMADALLEALNDGADFDMLARNHSIDVPTAMRGGERGWQPNALFAQTYAAAAADADFGSFVGPIQTDNGYHILVVYDREMRAIEADVRADVLQARLETWVSDRRESASIAVNEDWQAAIPEVLQPQRVPVAPGREA